MGVSVAIHMLLSIEIMFSTSCMTRLTPSFLLVKLKGKKQSNFTTGKEGHKVIFTETTSYLANVSQISHILRTYR